MGSVFTAVCRVLGGVIARYFVLFVREKIKIVFVNECLNNLEFNCLGVLTVHTNVMVVLIVGLYTRLDLVFISLKEFILFLFH